MGTKSQSSFAVNLDRYQILVTAVKGLGQAYAPAAAHISLAEIEKQLTAAQQAATDFNAKHAAWRKATDDRRNGFKPVRKYGTRMFRAFKTMVKDQEAVLTLEASKKKLDGTRIGKLSEGLLKSMGNDVQQPNGSVAQTGYTDLVNTLEQMQQLAALHTDYAPNEADLKIAGMSKLITDLRAANLAAVVSRNNLQLARQERNEIHCTGTVSIWQTARDVKDYILSLYGSNSPEYKQISGLRFKKTPLPKKKKKDRDEEAMQKAA